MARLLTTYISGSLILTGANSIVSGNLNVSGGDILASGANIGSISGINISATNFLNLPASANASGWSNYQAVANVDFQGIYSITGVNVISATRISATSAQYENVSGGAFTIGSVKNGIITLTGEATLDVTHNIVLTSGVNVILPNATTVSGQQYTIKNIHTVLASATPSAGQFIDGQAQLTFSQNTALTIISNGVNWYLI